MKTPVIKMTLQFNAIKWTGDNYTEVKSFAPDAYVRRAGHDTIEGLGPDYDADTLTVFCDSEIGRGIAGWNGANGEEEVIRGSWIIKDGQGKFFIAPDLTKLPCTEIEVID